MKRWIIRLILFFMTALFLAGCFSGEVHIKINQNRTADIEYKMGFDKSILALAGNEFLANWKKEAESEGYTVENYQEGSNIGVKVFKHCKNLKELQQILNSTKVSALGGNKTETVDFRIEPGFLTDKYQFEAIVDLTQIKMNEGNPGLNAAVLAGINFKYILTLPVKSVSNNAGTVSADGRTLEWLVIPGQKNIIKAEARVINISHIALISVGVLLLAGFFLLFYLFRIKSNQKQLGDKMS